MTSSRAAKLCSTIYHLVIAYFLDPRTHWFIQLSPIKETWGRFMWRHMVLVKSGATSFTSVGSRREGTLEKVYLGSMVLLKTVWNRILPATSFPIPCPFYLLSHSQQIAKHPRSKENVVWGSCCLAYLIACIDLFSFICWFFMFWFHHEQPNSAALCPCESLPAACWPHGCVSS